VKYIYKGSLYPTLEQILVDYDAATKPVSFKDMKKIAKPYKYTQSWAFSLWPGVHYNFVCRGHAHAEENVKNSATKKRRLASAEAAAKLVKKGGGTRRRR
jgi:3-methyladenine DNA glycosylase AlkD